MTARSTAFVLTRPPVLIPAILAVLFLINGWTVPGVIFAAVALMKSRWWFYDKNLDRRVRLIRERDQHGVDRMLSHGERNEIFLVDKYCEELTKSGCDDSLITETRERAWGIVRRAGMNDATVELRTFRQSLPALASEDPNLPPLHDRLQRELEMIRAARKELG